MLFRTLATLRTDIPLFSSVDELEWKGATPAFEALAARFDAAVRTGSASSEFTGDQGDQEFTGDQGLQEARVHGSEDCSRSSAVADGADGRWSAGGSTGGGPAGGSRGGARGPLHGARTSGRDDRHRQRARRPDVAGAVSRLREPLRRRGTRRDDVDLDEDPRPAGRDPHAARHLRARARPTCSRISRDSRRPMLCARSSSPGNPGTGWPRSARIGCRPARS